jgi:hypothetical protein
MFGLPEVGAWYLNTDSGEVFEVVAMDNVASDVEIQYVDGAINDFDMESWQSLPLTEIPEPEDWSAPFEIEPSEIDESDPTYIVDEGDAWDLIH